MLLINLQVSKKVSYIGFGYKCIKYNLFIYLDYSLDLYFKLKNHALVQVFQLNKAIECLNKIQFDRFYESK